jgi:hypothetical protein
MTGGDVGGGNVPVHVNKWSRFTPRTEQDSFISGLHSTYGHEPSSHPLKCEVQRSPLLSLNTKIKILSCYTSPFDEVRNAAKAQLHAALQSHFNYKLISTLTQTKSLLKDFKNYVKKFIRHDLFMYLF